MVVCHLEPLVAEDCDHDGHEEHEEGIRQTLESRDWRCDRSPSASGTGLLESTCEQCLAHELNRNGIAFQIQHPQPVQYKDVRLDCGYRIDILAENKLVLELKSVEELKGIHEAQLLTCMKLAGVKTGLLINFNVTNLKDGIKRFVL
jgi:GxxExxY protein